MATTDDNAHHRSFLERFLRLFADVQPREGVTCLILIANIFLILTAYYLIKPVREGWLAISVIQGLTTLEIKAYSAFAQSLLLMAIMPLYALLAAKLSRGKLILYVGGAFAGLLVLFWLTQPGLLLNRVPFAGVIFYLFVGIFSVTLVAQFWAFCSDLYGPERGRRLFPIVAIGAAAGAVSGSWFGERLVKLNSIDAFDLILLAVVPLLTAIAFALWSDRRGTYGEPSEFTTARWDEPAAPSNEGPYELILRHRYLTATALMMLVFSWVVASGDNILFGIVQENLRADLADKAPDPALFDQLLKEATTTFYGELYLWINVMTLVIQSFFVSRILRYGGMRLLLLTTPFVSLAAYATMAIAPILGLIKLLKVAENSSNYSVNNTARHMLWLPTTKEMLYQAKPTVDTVFVRLGDGLAALTILIGTRVVEFSNNDFIVVNICLVLIWIALSLYLYREHRRWTRSAKETVSTATATST
jgi:AAA family ATP:ADP antiporter